MFYRSRQRATLIRRTLVLHLYALSGRLCSGVRGSILIVVMPSAKPAVHPICLHNSALPCYII